MNDAKLLTVNELTEILQVEARAVYNYISDGKLRASKLGGTGPYRVSVSALAEFLGDSEVYVKAPLGREREARCN